MWRSDQHGRDGQFGRRLIVLDHEVNIKILIDALVTAGKVDPGERTQLLESMTDEVAELVLADNADQNELMGISRTNAASRSATKCGRSRPTLTQSPP